MWTQESLLESLRKHCRQDERVVAATLYGSFAVGEGDIINVIIWAEHPGTRRAGPQPGDPELVPPLSAVDGAARGSLHRPLAHPLTPAGTGGEPGKLRAIRPMHRIPGTSSAAPGVRFRMDVGRRDDDWPGAAPPAGITCTTV